MSAPKTFFDHQNDAHARTRWAVFGFTLTILAVVAGVMAVVGALLFWTADNETPPDFWDMAPIFSISGLIALVVILVSWLFRVFSMSDGPESVMRSLGGKAVPPDTADPDLRRLRNIVEEMSIASGVPTPDIYILEEAGINACAVGLDMKRAAVAATRGAVTQLTRDELQAVIGHEFSHILHGDMALNTQLIAWLAGLFSVSEIGRILMHLGTRVGIWASDDDESGLGGIALMFFLALCGAGVWIAGSLGVFFGRILQSAVSRQREYLADASAIQFTRNRDGMVNALRKLGVRGRRGHLQHHAYADCAHMMFANLSGFSFTGLLSTHPPLEQRIQRLDPGWDGSFLDIGNRPPPLPPRTAPPPLPPLRKTDPALPFLHVLESSGLPDAERIATARHWRENLSSVLRDSVLHPTHAQALVFWLLLHEPTASQLQLLQPHVDSELLRHLDHLLATQGLPKTNERLPLLDLALPTLRTLTPPQRRALLASVEDLIQADGEIALHEYALRSILTQALEEPTRQGRVSTRLHMREAQVETNVALSMLARLGSDTEEQASQAFDAARDRILGFHGGIELRLLDPKFCGLDALDSALERLRTLAPAFQERLLVAGLAAISHDGDLQAQELEAFRALAAALNLPAPPNLI